MFLVSAKEQGHAFKAFELGALDFLVYPLAPELLVDRVDEVFAITRESEPPVVESHGAEPPATAPPAPVLPHDNGSTDEAIVVTARNVDISRDGVIWLPGKVGKFHGSTLFVETALFGKPGVTLMMRFKLDDGIFVLNGHIKDIRYDDFQKPAWIEMVVREDEAWHRIHRYLQDNTGTPSAEPAQTAATFLRHPETLEKTAFRTGPMESAEVRDPSYDQRFYHSLIGKQLDNYRAITLIGSGSMGGVMQGWDVALEREVALKVISYELSSKEKFREMFIKEARVVSRLNHLNIAQIYYIGTSNDIFYYAMEFVDGKTLKELIDQESRLNVLKGLEYLITVCEALYYVHQNSIVHRDIKPANIMINTAGLIKVVDFGVAKTSDSKTKGEKSMIIGSPLYMSPEQVAGLTLDYRSDIYSLGATFYHALTGSPPFEADDYKDIMAQHISRPLPTMKEKNPRIPTPLAIIIEKMMAKDPFDRYKDCQTIANELKSLQTRILNRLRQSSEDKAG
jgi:predicted Ser/Thr protein kinase